ncbi:MAG: hypothetical protein GY845_02720 [Planctomycetes bacterium]|nr:hypothetical protein [Planctomycetota bacterium]
MKQENWLSIETNISQAYWCKLKDGKHAVFEPAELKDPQPRNVSWFDELFFGKITFPSISSRPATILLTGPAGIGKSTLALELCYRLADIKFGKDSSIGGKDKPWLSLYLSADMNVEQVYQKACSFGWKNVSERLYTGSPRQIPKDFGTFGLVAIRGAEHLKRHMGIAESVKAILSDGLDLLSIVDPSWATSAQAAKKLAEFAYKFGPWRSSGDPLRSELKRIQPDIVVIDSLNTIPMSEREQYFEDFINASSGRTKIVIFIMDSLQSKSVTNVWDYICDYLIRLDSVTQKDYYLRNIEIVKARYQDHVLGKQQLRIYPKRCLSCWNRERDGCLGDEHKCKQAASDKRRAHPYRHEGGIFIYPSIHYYLSKYKRRGHRGAPTFVDTRPKTLNKVVQRTNKRQGGLLPKGRCTAFVGRRGGHKSHLGYLHLLHRLQTYNESALVVSLRDDEEMTRRTMCNILRQEFNLEDPKRRIKELEIMDRLEILYYPPGYITPEEFYHRMFLSVYRLKEYSSNNTLTVLFNSLDQLSARFPLCAEQDIFVPGIIASLSGEEATSIFVAVDEPGQPAEQYGLIPMADLVLSFQLRKFSLEDYYQHIKLARITDEIPSITLVENKNPIKNTVVLQVMRFAGGEMAGAAGILELVTHAGSSIFKKDGLHFVPLSPEYPWGTELDERTD